MSLLYVVNNEDHAHQGLLGRLFFSGNVDRGAALVRSALAVGVLIYLLLTERSTGSLFGEHESIVYVAMLYSGYALTLLSTTFVWPQPHFSRRAISVVVDITVVTYAMIAAGETATPFFGGYLWATIANGLRYGRTFLYVTNIASAIGFMVVLAVSDYWQQNHVLGLGLLLWLVLLPVYVASLLKRLEIALQRANQASESKSHFLANMSHELRTPLNAIIGYSEMLQEDAEDRQDTQGVDDLQRIQHSANHLLNLINGILDLSKIEAGKMEVHFEDVDLDELIEEVMSVIRPLADKKGNTVQVDCRCEHDFIYTDKIKLKQTLFNLLSNANKFTDAGLIELLVYPEAHNHQTRLLFKVRDRGIGIAEGDLKRLFEPFVQVDDSTTRRYEGTGLGLTITKRFVNMLGGEIDVSSTAGQGTEFVVSFPISRTQSSENEAGRREHNQKAVASRFAPVLAGTERRRRVSTILVIDDDEHARDLFGRNLTREGFYVLTAANGLDGIRMANDHHPDVIILDVMMPAMDGWSVLKVLKNDARTTAIPVLMVSMTDNARFGVALGASDYILKPINIDRITDAIKKWLRRDSRKPILLSTDESQLAESIRVVMDKHGYQVLLPETDSHAEDMLERHNPCLVLLDLMSDGGSNIERLNSLSEAARQKDIPVIALTDDNTESDRFQRLRSNVDQIIDKQAGSSEGLILDILKLVKLQLNPTEPEPSRKTA